MKLRAMLSVFKGLRMFMRVRRLESLFMSLTMCQICGGLFVTQYMDLMVLDADDTVVGSCCGGCRNAAIRAGWNFDIEGAAKRRRIRHAQANEKRARKNQASQREDARPEGDQEAGAESTQAG